MPSSCHLPPAMPCPCGSGKPLSDCCLPLIEGEMPAPTAESLMRSRYTAHALGKIDYLMATWATEDKSPQVKQSVADWSHNADWKGLKILSTKEGAASDQQGIVEFVASFKMNGKFHKHHEVSRFEQRNGRWLYIDALN